MNKRIRTTALVAAAIVAPLLLGAASCNSPRGPVVSLYESPDCTKKDAAKPWAIVVKQTEQKQTVICTTAEEAGQYAVGDTYPKG